MVDEVLGTRGLTDQVAGPGTDRDVGGLSTWHAEGHVVDLVDEQRHCVGHVSECESGRDLSDQSVEVAHGSGGGVFDGHLQQFCRLLGPTGHHRDETLALSDAV